MANLAQLQCFNKILLQKMERMEIEHKKKMDKLQSTYDSLMEETIHGGERVDMYMVRYCKGCELWFNGEDQGVCCDDCSCYSCDNCKDDENTGIYECNECGEAICRNCNEFKMLDCCKACYVLEQYPLVISEVFSKYDSVVYEFKQRHV